MDKVIRFFLHHKVFTLLLFGLATVACMFLSTTVGVNYDMMDYLPPDSPSTIALDVMEQEYNQATPNMRIMVPDISIAQALQLKEELRQVDGVNAINWLDDSVNIYAPIETLDQKTVETWYKDGTALFSLTIDSAKHIEANEAIRALLPENAAMSGESVNSASAMSSTSDEISNMMFIVIPIILIILFLTTDSWFEPLLFLLTVGIAIVFNMGTNAIFGEISFVTQAAASILQLAVSMDYSIFILHRFNEFREEGLDLQEAMLKAVKKSFSSVMASGLTTVVGFAALIIMRFRIGPDMGLVMAKAIFFSLFCALVLLPVLALMTYKLIDKTHHKRVIPPLKFLGKFALKLRVPVVILFCIVLVPSILASQQNQFTYGSSGMFGDESSQVGRETRLINDTFGKSNTMVLMVPKDHVSTEKQMYNELKDLPHINSVISYVGTVSEQIPVEYVPKELSEQLISEHYSRLILTLDMDPEGDEAFEQVQRVRAVAQKYFPDEYLLAGDSVNTYDMKEVVTQDNVRVNIVSLIAIAIILIVTFKSISVPIILLLVIESSIWLNLTFPYFAGQQMFYIGYLIISSIQLGATIDYAILFTNRYIENRSVMPKHQAGCQTVCDTAVSILTSGSILAICGIIMGVICTNKVISQLGILVGRGAILSTLTVLVALPAFLMLFDRVIQITSHKLHFYNETKPEKEKAL